MIGSASSSNSCTGASSAIGANSGSRYGSWPSRSLQTRRTPQARVCLSMLVLMPARQLHLVRERTGIRAAARRSSRLPPGSAHRRRPPWGDAVILARLWPLALQHAIHVGCRMIVPGDENESRVSAGLTFAQDAQKGGSTISPSMNFRRATTSPSARRTCSHSIWPSGCHLWHRQVYDATEHWIVRVQ